MKVLRSSPLGAAGVRPETVTRSGAAVARRRPRSQPDRE
jgi:hypothetical protein